MKVETSRRFHSLNKWMTLKRSVDLITILLKPSSLFLLTSKESLLQFAYSTLFQLSFPPGGGCDRWTRTKGNNNIPETESIIFRKPYQMLCNSFCGSKVHYFFISKFWLWFSKFNFAFQNVSDPFVQFLK